MKLKKLIALICLIILCTQILPLRQIGAVLFNNQLTEEIADSTDSGKKLSIEKDIDYLPAFISYHTPGLTGTNNHSTSAHSPLIQLHIAEVQTPPPDIM